MPSSRTPSSSLSSDDAPAIQHAVAPGNATGERAGRHVWLPIFAGLCSSLVAIGLARFAYTPLIPPLIDSHWFTSDDVVYLGAANLAGYLLGALMGRPIGARISPVTALRIMMTACAVSFVACAFPLSVAWYFGWRLLSGIAGGVIMVLVAATVLPHVPDGRKGLASGAIFVGVGLGVMCSGTIVPLLLHEGLRETWLGLGVFSAILTAASWFAWPRQSPSSAQARSAASSAAAKSASTTAAASALQPQRAIEAAPTAKEVRALYVQYALMAIGLVPGMVFIVDYIARGLGAGAHLGAMFWVLYGAGAIIGPPIYGLAADRLGSRSATRVLLLVQALAVGGLLLTRDYAAVAMLTIILGSFPPGIAPLVLARVRDLAKGRPERQNIMWSRLTVTFAAAQAASGYAFSAIFNATGNDHRMLFSLAMLSIVIALVIDLVLRRSTASGTGTGSGVGGSGSSVGIEVRR